MTALTASHDHVLVEGAGGLLVELTEAGETLADLALALPGAAAIVVARSALGTLNHTMLTREALQGRGIRSLGTVLGSWPASPSHLERTNRDHLAARPDGLLGAVPHGAPTRDPAQFRDAAPTWLPGLGQRLGTP
ncbi:ATP-dependent dethiobiotin synthetase BioD [Intrasporangium calvum]|uniref:ATP-dependent dethiobiotin synthetase BioD n=1 Tax=Intrasporangium calvum TaxID=53358 RepID=UPI002D79C93D|nr:AAA family ATPase [Intrasporangium calvum]